jgi:hypothetical protein
MNFFGGSLLADKTFKKILSIGYEFETHDLAKLSLHANKESLINSDLTLRLLKEKMEERSVKEVDANYLSVRIPIANSNSEKPKEESVNLEELDDEDREFMEAFAEEIELEKLEKHENDAYLEYFNENRKTDNKDTIKFQITNDVGEGDFADMLNEQCEELTIPKNDMYVFQTRAGKIFDFKFSETIEVCKTFTGVEYVVTYYSPTKENPHIVLDTFVDACSRIIDHLADVKKIRGALKIHDNSKHMYTTIGNIEDERCLYFKPKTNLFYMDTYDNKNTLKLKKLGDVDFIPQMTFRCKAIDAMEILKEILRKDNRLKRGKSVEDSEMMILQEINLVESIVDKLIEKHNETAKTKIQMTESMGQNLKTYLFLIFYKLYQYVQHSEEITYKKDPSKEEQNGAEEDNYLKDFLWFASRHSNYDLYNRIKQIMETHYGITSVKDVQNMLFQPEIIKPLYVHIDTEEDGDEADEEDEEKLAKIAEKIEEKEMIQAEEDEKINKILSADMHNDNASYGNPMKSLLSYFKYFETASGDWLIRENIDAFSTTFDLKDDIILIENRFFRYEIGMLLRNLVDKKLSKKGTMTINEMYRVVHALYGKKIGNMRNLERNPFKKRLSKKCKSGYYRDIDFNCVKQKTRKHTRKPGYTKASLKNLLLKNKNKKTEKLRSTTVSTRSNVSNGANSNQKSISHETGSASKSNSMSTKPSNVTATSNISKSTR